MSEDGFITVFVKRMEANVRFTVKPSAGPGDVPIGTSAGLGRGFYFIVHVSFPATRSLQNHDAWIQGMMFQLCIVQAGPLK